METNSMCRLFRNFNRLKFHQLFLHFLTKGPIFLEKYWYYFHCPKNVLCSILSFVLWIFPPLAVELESANSIQNAISKSLFQDSFRHIFWAMRKMHHTLWKKQPLPILCNLNVKFSENNAEKAFDVIKWCMDQIELTKVAESWRQEKKRGWMQAI